jgi:ABC-2 type transport system permease protein
MWQRIGAIIQKEFIQALRDRTTLVIMLSIPMINLVLFAYAINMNVRHIPLVVADQSLDQRSQDYVNALVNSGYFDVIASAADQAGVIRAIDAGTARAGIVIPPNFAEHVQRGDAQVLALVDGSDLFTSQSAYTAANSIGQSFSAGLVMEDIRRMGAAVTTPALNAQIRILYNPDLKDLWFIIPGIAAMLMQTQTIVLTAAAVVREREFGTIEQILVTPIRPWELMIGKIAPYVVIAMINMLTVLLAAMGFFHVPFQGSIWLFLALTFIFVFSGLGLGLLISTVSQNHRQSQQLVMLIMMVALILGGFIFPRYSMPTVIQWVGDLFPLTYFIPIARGIITKGVGFEPLAGSVAALVVYMVVVMFLATRFFRERLD